VFPIADLANFNFHMCTVLLIFSIKNAGPRTCTIGVAATGYSVNAEIAVLSFLG
jgi:hypothetical protein